MQIGYSASVTAFSPLSACVSTVVYCFARDQRPLREKHSVLPARFKRILDFAEADTELMVNTGHIAAHPAGQGSRNYDVDDDDF
jgi:hypothetical protein